MSKNVQGLDVLGRRYAAWVRTITLPLAAAAGLLAAPDEAMRTRVLCAAAVVGLWSAVYVRRVRTGPTAWLTVVDTAVLSAVALCTVWLVAPAWLSTGKSWVVPFVSFAAVVYQYYASRLMGALCAGCLTVSMLAGTAVALPVGASSAGLVTAAWSSVLAVLGRLLWTFVMAGATRADDMLAAVEAARTAQAAAARDRAAENEWAAVLHDNPAQTLMLVGQGRIGDATVLAAAARRDLVALATIDRAGTHEVDLAARLLPALEVVPITVNTRTTGGLRVPSAVADAFVGATTEALNNVLRHAGIDEARVVVVDDDALVRVEIVDEGAGFNPDAVPDSSRGLRHSIRARMERCGGSASVTTGIGEGTRIALEWRR